MRRFKFFTDLTKEEQWLNEMARRGYHLMYRSLGYRFKKGEPKNTIYKIDYRKFKRKADFMDYEMMFEDSGWSRLPCPRRNGHQYFERIDERATEDIFSDQQSKAARYKRISDLYLTQFYISIPLIFIFYIVDMLPTNFNPVNWYLTPGLWDMEGELFWAAFLFETPFALMRGLAVYFIILTILLCGFYGLRAKKHYEKEAA